MILASIKKLPFAFVIAAASSAAFCASPAYGQVPIQNITYEQAIPAYGPYGGPVAAASYQGETEEVEVSDSEDTSLMDVLWDNYVTPFEYAGSIDRRLMTTLAYDSQYFQINAEAVSLSREDSNDSFAVTNLGPSAVPGVADNPVLSTGQADLTTEEAGFRIAGRINMFHSMQLEATYMGQVQWGNTANVTDAGNNLFSIVTGFQLTAPPTVGWNLASIQSISYRSQLDTFELNTRWPWWDTNHPLTGAWIMGVRYLVLDERFVHSGTTGTDSAFFQVDTANDLVGFQIGGEFLTAAHAGVIVGGDLKAGVFGNAASSATRFGDTVSGTTTVEPKVRQTQLAFVAEANLSVQTQLYRGWYFRGGYTGMYINGLALGPDAFRASVISGIGAAFPTTGSVFAHGAFGGFGLMY